MFGYLWIFIRVRTLSVGVRISNFSQINIYLFVYFTISVWISVQVFGTDSDGNSGPGKMSIPGRMYVFVRFTFQFFWSYFAHVNKNVCLLLWYRISSLIPSDQIRNNVNFIYHIEKQC